MKRFYKKFLEILTYLVWVHGKKNVFEKYWQDQGKNREVIRSFVCSSSPHSVFEFGMFVGRNLRYLENMATSGCDINKHAINFASQKLSGNYYHVRCLDDLSHPVELYDVVLCTAVFYAVDRQSVVQILNKLKYFGSEIVIGCNFERPYSNRFYYHDYDSILRETGLTLIDKIDVPEKSSAITHLVRLKI